MKTNNLFKYLTERGLIAQTVFPEELEDLLNNKKINFYIGFDPTADSLHVGHFLMLQISRILQQYGHKPYLILGGGTGHVGDPTGRSDMRQMMTSQVIENNVKNFEKQISKFLSFEGDNKAVFLNNADWLLNLKWVNLLREVGQWISVNKMLATDAYKARWENGLSFLELNYMVMQSYDFLHLNRTYDVQLQIGGNDQWSNILAGVDIIRRLEKKTVYGMTVPLLTKYDGTKMGKTANGALWLDANKTSPYEFYQYWINVNDLDVEKLFLSLTDVPKDEIDQLVANKGKQMVEAKKRLAFILTSVIHGEDNAQLAKTQSEAAFSNDEVNMPTMELKLADNSVCGLVVQAGLASSKSEARRLITSGGISLDDIKITDPQALIPDNLIASKKFILHKGKKQHICINILEN